MAGEIRIIAKLEDQLSKDLRKLATDTSSAMANVNAQLKEAETKLASLGRTKTTASNRNELKETIANLKREREEILKNEKAEEQRLKSTYKYEAQRRKEAERTASAIENASRREVQAKDKVVHGNYKEDASRRALSTSLVRHIRQLESMAVAYYALTSAYSITVGKGIELNRQYESQSLGLAAILASKTKLINSNGMEATSYEKLKASQTVMASTMEKIREAAEKTPATFDEMVGFYQQAIGHALSAGKSFGNNITEISDNTIKLTQRMSLLGSATGMSMDRINEEIRSLMSGNASSDSLLASIIFGSPSKANEAIKEAKKRTGGLTELFNKKLVDIDTLLGANTFDMVLANVSSNIDKIRKEASKPMFDDMKTSLENIQKFLKENDEEIVKSFKTIYGESKALGGVILDAGGLIVDSFSNIAEAVTLTFGLINDTIADSSDQAVTDFNFFDYAILGLQTLITATKVSVSFIEKELKHIPDAMSGAFDFITKLNPQRFVADMIPVKTGNKINGKDVYTTMGAHREAYAKYDANVKTSGDAKFDKEVDKNLDQLVNTYNRLKKSHEQNTKATKADTASLDDILKRLSALKGEGEDGAEGLDKAGKAAKKVAEELAKLNKELDNKIFDLTASDYEKSVKKIEDEVQKFRDGSANKTETAKLDSLLRGQYLEDEYKKATEQFDKLDKETEERTNKRLDLEEDMWKELNQLSGNWYDNELLEISKRYNSYIEQSGDVVRANEIFYKQLSAMDKKRFTEQTEEAEKAYKEQNKFWLDLFDDVEKAMDNQIFDAMTGKWENWGDWFKDFWDSLATSIMRSFSSKISNQLIGAIEDAMLGTSNQQGGGIQNIFSSFGLFGGSSQGSMPSFVGQTLSTNDYSSIKGLQGSSVSGDGVTTTAGKTIIDSNGKILSTGSDIGSLVDNMSSLNSISKLGEYYDSAKAFFGYGSSAVSSAGDAFGGLGSADAFNAMWGEGSATATGSTSTALASSTGASSWLSSIGTWAGYAALFKAISGVLWKSGGPMDKLFGTTYASYAHDSMKYGAGSYNWSTGQLNQGYGHLTDASQWASNLNYMNPYNPAQWSNYNSRDWANMHYIANLNPASAISGHMDPIFSGIMGGLFGSGETTTSPLWQWANYTLGNASATQASGQYTMPMMSSTDGGLLGGDEVAYWFNISNLTSAQSTGIKQYIGALDDLLEQLGIADNLLVEGGTFKSLQAFLDTNVLYSFFDKLTIADSVTVTNAWKEYATSISKSTIEAFNEVVGSMIGYKRGFTEWYLGSGSEAQLKFTSEYLKTDLDKLMSSIGVSGVTTDNFLSRYEEAMTALYTPETSQAWQSLGDALMKSTEAAKAYDEALKASLGNTTILPTDMMLGRVSTTPTPILIRDMVTQQQAQNTQTSQMVAQLYEVIKVLKAQLSLAQFGTNQGIPA